MVSLPTTAVYPSQDDIGAALWWTPNEYAQDAPQNPNPRPQLPSLAATATPADQALYEALTTLYSDPSQGPAILDRVRFGDLAPGRLPETFGPGARYTDPNLINFTQAQQYNASLQDESTILGDPFFTALLGTGLAAGGAGLLGAAGAEAIASPLPLTLPEGVLATGGVGTDLGALGAGALGPAAAGAGALGAGAVGSASGGLTLGQLLGYLGVANAGANVAQNPSSASAGGLLGSGAGLALGLPGLGIAGSLLGGAAGGGQQVADGQQGSANLGPLLAALVGLGGTGLSLAGGFQQAGRQDTQYQQGQQLYQLLTQLAQQYQQQQQQTYGQQQGAYGQQQQLFNLLQQIYGKNIDQVYPQIAAQTNQDIGNRQEVFGERQAAGQRLSNPYTAQDGINTMTQGLTGAARDEVLRGIQRDAAMRGVSDGGAYQDILATALARYDLPYRQMGAQNFLSTQGLGLGQFTYPPAGPYTPYLPYGPQNVPQPPQPPQPAQFPYPGQLTYIPQSGNPGQTIGQAGNLIGNLVTALGLGGSTSLSNLFGSSGTGSMGFSGGGNPFNTSEFGTGAGAGSDIGFGLGDPTGAGFGFGLGGDFSVDPSLLGAY